MTLSETLTIELDRHWLYLADGQARCTCGAWSLAPTEAEPFTEGERLPQFSRHVADSVVATIRTPIEDTIVDHFSYGRHGYSLRSCARDAVIALAGLAK